MSITTRITIGNRTEEFLSSPETLATNIYATLLIRGMGVAVCQRIEQALLVDNSDSFQFQEGEISISTCEILTEQRTQAALSAA